MDRGSISSVIMVEDTSRLERLKERQQALLRRLQNLSEAQCLAERQAAVLERVARLEKGRASCAPQEVAVPAAAAVAAPPCGLQQPGEGEVSEVQARLTSILQGDGVASFRFVRAPPGYYEQPLEFRMGVVGAASVHHLCKTIVMQNTRAPPEVTDCSDPTLSKYYMICVQYTARIHVDKLHAFVRNLAAQAGHKVSRKQVNLRLVPEDVNAQLTGFQHNAVAPIGCRTRLPLIVSHRVAELAPDFFWLGGGEVDLKLGVRWAEFAAAYHPYVADCTIDGEE